VDARGFSLNPTTLSSAEPSSSQISANSRLTI